MSAKYSSRFKAACTTAAIFAAFSMSAVSAGECVATPVTPVAEGDLATFNTKSGTWRVRPSGEGFIWSLDESPGWSSAMACNDTEQQKVLNIGKWTLLVPAHACKFAQDSSPVKMSSSFIQQAIDDGRWVSYDSGSASDWPVAFGVPSWLTGSLQSYTESVYDPASLNGESSSKNNVGVISGQGGEYPTSRGSIDEADSELIIKAVNGESIESYTDAMYNAAFAFAGYPYRAAFTGDMLRDPQKPISGQQYEFKLSRLEVTDEVYSVSADSTWQQDPSHLTNVGWALWLATEDPRIGMIVQSAAQFVLAAQGENYRLAYMQNGKGNVSDYRCSVTQDRAIYNCMNAMWKARDVAERTRSADKILWSLGRVNEMYEQTTEQIQAITDEVKNSPIGDAELHALKENSSPFNLAFCATYQRSDGSEFSLLAKSNFMDAQYGSVPMYLRAQKGEQLGRDLLSTVADHMVARSLYLGGAAGVDGRRDLRGSSMPIGPCIFDGTFTVAGSLPFNDRTGWADWVEQQDIMTREGLQPPTDSFNDARADKVVQNLFILNAAKKMVASGRIGAVTDLDAAIAAVELARQKTDQGRLGFGLWNKHMATVD